MHGCFRQIRSVVAVLVTSLIATACTHNWEEVIDTKLDERTKADVDSRVIRDLAVLWPAFHPSEINVRRHQAIRTVAGWGCKWTRMDDAYVVCDASLGGYSAGVYSTCRAHFQYPASTQYPTLYERSVGECAEFASRLNIWMLDFDKVEQVPEAEAMIRADATLERIYGTRCRRVVWRPSITVAWLRSRPKGSSPLEPIIWAIYEADLPEGTRRMEVWISLLDGNIRMIDLKPTNWENRTDRGA